MSRTLSRFSLVPLVAIFLLAAPAPARAQAANCDEERDVTPRALDELTWKQLNSAYELVGEEEYDEAYERLQVLLGRASRDKYLQAVLSQALAQTEWSRKNYDAALQYFEQAVELDTLPDQTHFALMYQISQLYFMKDRFQEALDALELWFCKVPEKEITSHAYVLKASIYARMDDYANVLPAIDQAIQMDENPQESWYQLKLASHYELEQFPQAAQTLEILISKWPAKKVYWTQLSQIYYKLKQEDKALATMALAYRNDLLDNQADLLYLASLYSGADIPYKSAQVMEKVPCWRDSRSLASSLE